MASIEALEKYPTPQQRPIAVNKPRSAAAHVLEEGTHRLGVFLGTRHQMQKHFGARCRKTPGGQHRLALLPGADAFGDAVDEQIGDLIVTKIARDEFLVVCP
jgi:hypothetical protein